MTDNEIIKALECCIEMECTKCPMNYDDCEERDFDNLVKRAIPIFNRLQAENSNLTSDLTSLQNDLTSAKAEIDRLKEENRVLKRDNHFNESGIFNLLYGSLVYSKTFEDFNKFRKDFKAETVKEFAERLCKERVSNDPVVIAVKTELKLMEGETK